MESGWVGVVCRLHNSMIINTIDNRMIINTKTYFDKNGNIFSFGTSETAK